MIALLHSSRCLGCILVSLMLCVCKIVLPVADSSPLTATSVTPSNTASPPPSAPAGLQGVVEPADAPGCLYTTYMEHYGSSGQLAVTNMETAVIVASFYENVTALPASAVELQLDNGQSGTVSDVQPFPGQANVFLIEVTEMSLPLLWEL